MSLQSQGFRYVHRGNEFKWVHPAEILPTDVDCSDMGDDEFAEYVANNGLSTSCRAGVAMANATA